MNNVKESSSSSSMSVVSHSSNSSSSVASPCVLPQDNNEQEHRNTPKTTTTTPQRQQRSLSTLASSFSFRRSVRLVFVGRQHDDNNNDGNNNIAIVRYSVAICHLFLFMTATQLFLTSMEGLLVVTSSTTVIWTNVAFHMVYCFGYASFLVLYAISKTIRPTSTYVVGIALYFIGYVMFLTIFILQLRLVEKHEVADNNNNNNHHHQTTLTTNDILYKTSSFFFVIGSLFLMYATRRRRKRGSKNKCSSNMMKLIFHRSMGLFWGSTCFGLGSIIFSVDALLSLPLLDSRNNNNSISVSYALIVTGLTLFTIGRVFFLHGSTTDACNVWLRSSGSKMSRTITTTTTTTT